MILVNFISTRFSWQRLILFKTSFHRLIVSIEIQFNLNEYKAHTGTNNKDVFFSLWNKLSLPCFNRFSGQTFLHHFLGDFNWLTSFKKLWDDFKQILAEFISVLKHQKSTLMKKTHVFINSDCLSKKQINILINRRCEGRWLANGQKPHLYISPRFYSSSFLQIIRDNRGFRESRAQRISL